MSFEVVAGVDGSAPSEAAARWAAYDAYRRGCGLRLVAVTRDTRAFGDDAPQGMPGFVPVLREHLADLLPELAITCEAVPGTPWSVLASAGRRRGLLVLGSRGPGGPAGLTGSVALRAATEAHCPVVLVRPGAEDAEAGRGPVVVGVEPDRPCDEVLDFAFAQAARCGAGLRVLAARDRGTSAGEPGLGEAVARPWDTYPDVRVTSEVTGRSAVSALVEVSRTAALVVLGRRIRRLPLAALRLGPVAHGVIHHAHGPVVIVPHP
ncbi:universal stress protein [Streptomyces sp. SP17BM10]|uniref:universal stress protein n=1 Tax=Streptomyces sp. SP17BM10 TaxID=3002530 RepID=UPI002E761059|nr:universal stress protein [Streptomyces sp. SP17BM10]MEE1786694.1 universal stress protein [Streptomyces sp. SP17BM10]